MSNTHTREPEYDLGVSTGLTSLIFFLFKVGITIAFFLIPLHLAAPYGDRRRGIPADPQSEGFTTRAMQWISGIWWGLGGAAVVLTALTAVIVPIAAIPVLLAGLVAGLYVAARRASASQGYWYSVPRFRSDMVSAFTGPRSRWVAASLSGVVVITASLMWAGVVELPVLIAVLAALQISGFVLALRLGFRHATFIEWGQIKRERLVPDVASILGVPASALDSVEIREVHETGAVQVFPTPPAARLKTRAEIEARVAAVRPELTVASWSPEGLELVLADPEILDAREALAASGGLIGGLESLDAPTAAVSEFPDDGITFDFSSGFAAEGPSLRKE